MTAHYGVYGVTEAWSNNYTYIIRLVYISNSDVNDHLSLTSIHSVAVSVLQ